MLEARLGRMSWGQKAEASQCNCSGRIFANSSVSMKEYCVQDKLAMVRTDWKLHVRVQSDAAPVTWSMRYWRRQWCWGCGCCRFCCRWRHAEGVEVLCDWRFQPPNTLLKQERFLLAVAICYHMLQYTKGVCLKTGFSIPSTGESSLWNGHQLGGNSTFSDTSICDFVLFVSFVSFRCRCSSCPRPALHGTALRNHKGTKQIQTIHSKPQKDRRAINPTNNSDELLFDLFWG